MAQICLQWSSTSAWDLVEIVAETWLSLKGGRGAGASPMAATFSLIPGFSGSRVVVEDLDTAEAGFHHHWRDHVPCVCQKETCTSIVPLLPSVLLTYDPS